MLKKPMHHLPQRLKNKIYLIVFIMLIIVLMGLGKRWIDYSKLKRETQENAVPLVSTLKANRGNAFEEILLPGNVQAWHEATIFARTNGYIKRWLVDIGDKVKKDQLLAIIETPEVDAQLRQAQADLNTAIANHELAESTADRWVNLLTTNSVSKQDADEKISTEKSQRAIVNSTKANRDRLQQLVDFNKITAPFDGIITSRTTDIGSLIDAGSNAPVPLFHIVQGNKLRIYVNVPQYYSTRLSSKVEVSLEFAEHPGKIFPAKLIRTAKAIDPTTRTLLVEFEENNANYELLPGGYTQVHLKFPALSNKIVLPVNTLLFRAQGLQVATLDKQGKVVLKSVKIARDFGKEVEIDSGIMEGEIIIVNPPDALESGQQVRLASKKEANNKKIKKPKDDKVIQS